MTYTIKTSKIGKAPIQTTHNNSSPMKFSGEKRTDSSVRYNEDGSVDSTPVGHRKAKQGRLSWGGAVKDAKEKQGGDKRPVDANKAIRDKHATEKQQKKDRDKSLQSSAGSGGMRMEYDSMG
jgi:hypothetical protein